MMDKGKNFIIAMIVVLPFGGSVVLNVLYHNKIRRMEGFSGEFMATLDTLRTLQQSNILEAQMIGKEFPEFELENIIGEYDSRNQFKEVQYYVVFVSAFSSCSLCRDDEIRLWKSYLDQTRIEIRIVGIVPENISNDKQKSAIQRQLQAYRLNFPWFFDRSQILLNYLNLSPEQTPIVFLVNSDDIILLAHQAVPYHTIKTKRFHRMLTRLLASSMRKS